MQKKIKKFLKLEYLRKKYGFSQIDFAGFLGIKQSSYSCKVNHKTPFTFDEMMILHDRINKAATKLGDTYLSLNDIFLE